MGWRTIVSVLGLAVMAAHAPAQANQLQMAALALAQATPGGGQSSPLPLPSPVEKELAARASNVTEVTLGRNMLAFAAKFMDNKDEDEAATRKLIEGLDGVYVREYDFDKEGEYSPDQIEKLRQYFETSEWTPIVRERSKHDGDNTDVMMKIVNGETHGLFVLETEPRELTIVLILGPIHLDDLHRLTHLSGLGALGDIADDSTVKQKEKAEKDKLKSKKGDEQ
ncbi:MAG TPA: DUF4252 domain-containing protein [Terracidiphilus sp.]|nr:DUF4252 domain-containing protein [Terracidiphilus sp.]